MAKIIDLLKADDRRDVIHEVVQSLAEGQVVGLPTETVYVAAACASQASAGQRLCELTNSLGIADCVLAVLGPQEARDYLPGAPPLAEKLLRRFWPGPVTLTFERELAAGLTRSLPVPAQQALASGGDFALRAPSGEPFSGIQRLMPAPLLLSGEIDRRGSAYTTASALASAAGSRLDLMVDAGPCKRGVPTSIVRVAGDRWDLVREGAVSHRTLHRLAGNLVLFVCTGNTCRSPMAEALFRKLLAERLGCPEDELVDRGYIVASAGVAASAGCPASPEAAEILEARGADLRSHESQPVTLHLLSQADRIFTMTRSHREQLLRDYPQLADRIGLLARDGSDVIDPMGSGLDEYRRCADQVEQHLRAILDQLIAESSEHRS